MVDVPAEVEQQISSMTEGEWAAFTARVRAPDTAEALRAAVSKHVSGDRLDAVMRIVDPTAFVGDDGSIDEAKVGQQLGTLFGAGASGPPRPGDPHAGGAGKAEAARRFGGKQPEPAPAPVAGVHAGRAVQQPGAVEAELQKRFGDRRFGKRENS
ncbi:MAG: hypothetical protein QOH91_1612 [Mycobacterium sp.]|jgi:hypothetical protein|nr:hypothetical protein [Mycobacterium sp.]